MPGADPARDLRNGNRVADAQSAGFLVYRSFCARCHRDDGSGAPPAFPAFEGPPRTQMPTFAAVLTNMQIAQAPTYVRGAWATTRSRSPRTT